ncbi:putative pumilio homolog 7, chloroplastic isoform X2 [Durio zibethinus]|uniref:Pumilio homolog 7, chloroplastic isoform X2 n=1 Tax=Durio zibethinus TaxID=66656 RepID=A0A6P5XCN6_DURZI|nr:putative pumilio homolog 7, chloroplastic isoform X2 [Durio zibethinus]
MFEATAEIGKKKKKNRGNMKDDEELEMLLDEIPHATSHNHHHLHQQHENKHVNGSFHGMFGLMYDDDTSSHYYKHTCASPVSGFSLQSDGSSSSLFSNNGQSLSDNGSPTPPPLEDLMPHLPNGLLLDSAVRKKASSDGLIGELGLCRNLSKMYISNDQENVASSFRDFSLESDGIQPNDQINVDKYGSCDKMRKGDFVGIQSPVPMSVPLSFNGGMNMAFSGLPQQQYRISNFLGSQLYPGCSSDLISQQGMNCWNGAMRSPWQKKEQTCSYHQGGNSILNLSTPLSKLSVNDALIYGQRNGLSWNEERGGLNFHGSPRLIQATPHASVENLLQHGLPLSNGLARTHSNVGIPHGGLEAFTSEGSFIVQGEGLNYVINKGFDYSREQNKGSLQEIGVSKRLEIRSQLDGWSQIAAACGNAKNAKLYSPFSLPPKYNSLAEARGYIYLIAKDQHGCRFLQRVFDEGTQQDVQIIFKEIIDHVVELMMNPFGNYLMQKLLDVCNEEQRKQILLMVSEEPGQLVRISLNTHGTRVVQKLIETLKTRQQISLVISALEPGFLSLIKDLNGNHVVQRCLQCLSSEDNKHCVDIATHQHGCCVLQRCISYSTGEYREKLVEEISTNGLQLAQDAYGNYVVQFVLELKIPSATSTLVSQFEGNYVHLSSQKFSSHVVEKCLVVLNDAIRSRIIHELLSATHFEKLLQDPHANYVVQTALRVSEGPLHNSLVEAIESHKAFARNCPYSKRIFSQKLLKK